MSLLENLPHECSIVSMGSALDSIGGRLYRPTIVAEEVACWQQAMSASESMKYEKRGQRVDTKIYFSENPNLTEQHRILITKRFGIATTNQDVEDVRNPDVFSVVSTANPDASAGCGVLWRVECRKETGATQ